MTVQSPIKAAGLSCRVSLRKLLVVPAVLAAAGVQASGDSSQGWLSLNAENDNFVVDQDRHYVNGLNFAYLTPTLGPGQGWTGRSALAVTDALPLVFPTDATLIDTRIEWTPLGQQIFTPSNKSASVPDPSDRPYAGWLYSGLSLMQDDDARQLNSLSVSLGIVGSGSLGRQVQNGFHSAFGYGSANGWDHQLKNEPALTIAYQRKWRFSTVLLPARGLEADVVPELGATLGNVLLYGEATTTLRLGWGLDASYGPRLLQPGPTAGGYFNPERAARSWGGYLIAGFQGRAVEHNIFLDGNTYQDSPSVPKYPWVHDEYFGVSAYGWRRVRMDFTYVRRSEEFHGQNGIDQFGSVDVSFRL